MRLLKLSLLSTVALLGLWACSDKEEIPAVDDGKGIVDSGDNDNDDDNTGGSTEEYDDTYYAENAVIGSDNENFTATDEGGAVSFGAEGGEVVVNVTIGTGWVVENDAGDWCDATADIDAGTLTVTAGENADEDVRTGTLTLKTATDGIEFATIAVSQDIYETPEITVSTTEVNLAAKGDGLTAEITVEANYGWTAETEAEWLTLTRDGDGLTITAAENEIVKEREAEVTLTSVNGIFSATVTVAVTQDAAEPDVSATALIYEYTLTEANTTVTLNLYGTVDCTVDWGDGDTETVTSTLPTHTYSETGVYDVVIDGTVTALYSKDFTSSSNTNTTLTAVLQWGRTGLTDMQYAFYYYVALETIPADTAGSFSETTSFYFTFYNCNTLKEIPGGLLDYCENVTTMYATFGYCKSLTTIPAGLFDHCVNNTNFEYTFYADNSLTEIPAHLFDKCLEATSFKMCFHTNSGLTSLPDGLFANLSKVTNYEKTFYMCFYLTTLPADLFAGNTSATNMENTFSMCYRLTGIPENLFADCKNVTDFGSTFYNCNSLTGESAYDLVDGVKVHLYERGNYDGYAKVSTSSKCYYNCTGLSDYSGISSGWK